MVTTALIYLGYVKRRSLGFWIGLSIAVAVASLVIDQNTGDTTGPPYHDPVYNTAAFLIFWISATAFVVLSGLAVWRWARRPSGRDTSFRARRD
jgi:hypothetical protein